MNEETKTSEGAECARMYQKVGGEFKFQSCTFSPDAYLTMISWEVCSIISTFGWFVFVLVNLTLIPE